MLTEQENLRYTRQITLEDFGEEGQQKLKAASVLVVGAGGLGCPVLQYLASTGVGRIGIVDNDQVAESNLHRQVLYGTADIGRSKVYAAAEQVARINEWVEVETYHLKAESSNVLGLIQDYDVIVDATDNFASRYCLSDACVVQNKPLVYGSILRYEGQVSVFNYAEGPSYRCLFPEPPEPGAVPSCTEAGVIGVLPGIIGSIQANEVIKIITGIGTPLSGTLMIMDTQTMDVSQVHFERNKEEIEKVMAFADRFETQDYYEFCNNTMINQITPDELRQKMANNEDFQLIDVREQHEFDEVNMGGELIPMGEIVSQPERISKDKPVVIHCRTGQRSAMVINALQNQHGFDNLLNLDGVLKSARPQAKSPPDPLSKENSGPCDPLQIRMQRDRRMMPCVRE
jgi:adenylyltransferase/sulfurtransferase